MWRLGYFEVYIGRKLVSAPMGGVLKEDSPDRHFGVNRAPGTFLQDLLFDCRVSFDGAGAPATAVALNGSLDPFLRL